MSHQIEKSWITEAGYRAEIIFCTENFPSQILESHWRCGYVRVPSCHPLCNLDYNQSHECLRELINEDTPVGKRSMIDIFCFAASGEELPRICIALEAHGGITFAGEREKQGGWWFGFDCHHAGDTLNKCTQDYVWRECEFLAKQLKELEQWTPTEQCDAT